MKKYILSILCIFLIFESYSQEELTTDESVKNAFQGTRFVNGQSANLADHGKLLLQIQHRFGDISDGIYQLFGLDQATMRLGFEYGVGENINIGIGRSTFLKTYDASGKIRLVQQNNNFPFTAVISASGALPTIKDYYNDEHDNLSDKFAGAVQLHLAKTMGVIGIQVSPGYLSTGYIPVLNENLSVFTMSFGGAAKVSKKVSLNVEYLHGFNDKISTKYPLSFGVDLDTGGHLFQLILSNSQQMFDQALFTQTAGDWANGNIYFGFNLIREFRLKYY